ncbi:homeodomain-like protein [Tanacetum coccineum]
MNITGVFSEFSVDCIRWRDITGVFSEFSVSRAWEEFRPRGNEVNWFRIVWFPHSIPRHLWLVMRNSLKTQDKLRQWDVGINTDLNLLRCSLCNTQSDSHAHLFFECPYSSKVWKLVRHLADMELVPPILYDIVAHLQSMANKRTARSIFGKLILAASSYFVWLERNNRLFKNVKRTPEELRDVIMVTVRLKLLSFKFKNSAKIKVINDKDSSLVFGVFKFMKWVLEDPSYITGGELEYPRELFLVPGQMTYLVASLTPDSARSYVMYGASFTQRTVSSIPIVGSISPEGFLPPILLLVVIIVTVVIVAVILVVVVAIVGVVIVVVGGVPVGSVFLLGLLVPAIVAACASRVAKTLSATSFLMAA